jgi:hypothetical protein
MNLVCLAFEQAVPDLALLAAAKDSNHPWAVALRAAMGATVCPACYGHGKVFVMVLDSVQGVGGLHMARPMFKPHDLGTCQVCNGRGYAPEANPHKLILRGVIDDLVRLHRDCPADGPSDRSASRDWCKSNRWERCTDLTPHSGTDCYNGLDFLSLEVLLRLAGADFPSGGESTRPPGSTTGNTPIPPAKTIQVSFTNNTNYRVYFHLNDGKGLTTNLEPGQVRVYTMVFNRGITPAVAISQLSGNPLSFSVSDGGNYEFKIEGGKIKNFYKK